VTAADVQTATDALARVIARCAAAGATRA
jgi:hypothetical protein